MLGAREASSGLPRVEHRVLWLSDSPPPPPLVEDLRTRGITLLPSEPGGLRPCARLTLPSRRSEADAAAPTISGRRFAFLGAELTCMEPFGELLRMRGARVEAYALGSSPLEPMVALDPDVLVLQASELCALTLPMMSLVWRHATLRYVPTLLVAAEVTRGGAELPALLDALYTAGVLCADFDRVRDDARTQEQFAFDVDLLGPSRTLRALVESGRSLRVELENLEVLIDVYVVQGQVVAAQAGPPDRRLRASLGRAALDVFAQQDDGQVRVRALDAEGRMQASALTTPSLAPKQPRESVHARSSEVPGHLRASLHAQVSPEAIVASAARPAMLPPPNLHAPSPEKVVAVFRSVSSAPPQQAVPALTNDESRGTD